MVLSTSCMFHIFGVGGSFIADAPLSSFPVIVGRDPTGSQEAKRGWEERLKTTQEQK